MRAPGGMHDKNGGVTRFNPARHIGDDNRDPAPSNSPSSVNVTSNTGETPAERHDDDV